MKLTLLSSVLLPLLATAAPAPTAESNEPSSPPFGVMSSRSSSPIHLLPMTASAQSFWLGGETASYCPLETGCPPGKETVFAPGGSGLNVEVPGGQQVYINPDGALSFTQAHSANIPPGSTLGPFEYTPGKPYAHYTFNGSGFMACPTADNRWQVFAASQNANVPQGKVDDCLGFSAMAVPSKNSGAAAWQYT